MQDRWLIATGSLVIVLVGIVISVINSKAARDLLAQHGVWSDRLGGRGDGYLLVGSPKTPNRPGSPSRPARLASRPVKPCFADNGCWPRRRPSSDCGEPVLGH